MILASDFLTCPPNYFHLTYSYLLQFLSLSSRLDHNHNNVKMVQKVTLVIRQKITFMNHSSLLLQPSLQAGQQFRHQHLNHILKSILIQDNTVFMFNFTLVVKTFPKCKLCSTSFQQWCLSWVGAAVAEQRSQLG